MAERWFTEHGVCVTVNVSGHQLREADFVDVVLAVLAETGLPGRAQLLGRHRPPRQLHPAGRNQRG